MQVTCCEVTSLIDILLLHAVDERRLPLTSLSNQNQMFGPPILGNADAIADRLTIDNLSTEIKSAVIDRFRSLIDSAVPAGCDQFFEPANHRTRVRVVVTKSVT